MSRRYAGDGFCTGGTNKTALTITGSASIRPALYDLVVGSSATPADQAALFVVQRSTADGTDTAVTPRPLDPHDQAAIATMGRNNSAEPTYTANVILLNIALNQRATFRWVAAPGSEIFVDKAANAGIGLKTASGPGAVFDATMMFVE